MSLRSLTLAGLVVLAVLGLALVVLDDPGGRLPGGAFDAPLRVEPEAVAEGTPTPPGGTARAEPAAPLHTEADRLQVPGVPDAARVVLLPGSGSLRGRLVDAAGRPVAGEPVDLTVEADRWWTRFREDGRHDVVDRGTSGADGRFELEARAGVVHELRVGGLRHARRLIKPVTAGDDFEIVVEPGLTVEGTVVDGETGLALPGARVAAMDASGTLVAESDGRGVFRIGPVPDAALVLGAWADGHDVTIREVPAPGWGAVVLELPPGRTISGQVLDRETGEPLVGASVSIQLRGQVRVVGEPDPLEGDVSVHAWETFSDAAGHWSLEGLPSRSFRVEARAEGHLPEVTDRYLDRELGSDRSLTLRLRPAADVAALVLDDTSGEPVAGAHVQLVVPGAELDAADSDADGRVALSLLGWDGLSRVELVATDAAGRHARARLKRPDAEVELRLAEALALEVLVQDADGPVAGAQVAVSSDGAPTTLGLSGEDGRLLVSHRVAGGDLKRVLLQARHAGRQSLALTWKPEEEARPAPFLLDLDAGAFYAGRVLDVFGEPVGGAVVSTSRATPARTDDRGHFRLGPVDREVTDTVRLSADAEGFHRGRLDNVVPGDDWEILLTPVVTWLANTFDAGTGAPLDEVSGRLQQQVWKEGVQEWKALKAKPVRTGVPGSFRVELPGAGSYRLAVGAPDHQPAVSHVIDTDGLREPPPVDLFLSRAAVLLLTVEDRLGRPVPGVDLLLVDASAAREAGRPRGRLLKHGVAGRSDEQGRAVFTLGDGGRYRLASGPAEWLLPGELEVFPGVPVERRVVVPGTGDLELTLRDTAGDAVTRARVSLKALGDRRPYSLRRKARAGSGQDRLVVEALPEGLYQVTVSHHAQATWSGKVGVLAGQLARLDVTLAPPQPKAARPSGRGYRGPPDPGRKPDRDGR